jgi:3-phosphoshikimate 1-carboxyvinyltransferase
MKVEIFPSSLAGLLKPPASKSDFQRACAAALLTPGKTHIYNSGISNDDRAALSVAEHLGLKILTQNGPDLVVQGPQNSSPSGPTLHCGESGLCTRLFTPIAALSTASITIEGEGSLLRRPLTSLVEALQKTGVKVIGGPTLPLFIQGPLQPCNLELDGSDSSQTATGFLFAMAASGVRPLTLTLRNPVSLPYLALTVEVLRCFGWPVDWDGAGAFRFSEARKVPLNHLEYFVESDWSSAAALVVAGTLAGTIQLGGLQKESVQADRIILKILLAAGAQWSWEQEYLHVQKSALRAFVFDATHAPDLVPVLAIAAATATGESEIMGMNRLLHKESNRAETTFSLLRGFGIAHHFEGDSLLITGGLLQGGGTFDAQGDHRIAMAAAIGGLAANAPITILGAEAVQKSYPAFFFNLGSLGASMTIHS